ncbi:MAG: hypothetical protein HC849_02850 [Oscillatoriales cyanobacterium RU_3_3]|nr:hypothetical protein [Microcoleus sp. SU_5_6]NJL69418.1 hypothetical protein [Microcoleus sp. SM1_3_4]NJM59370.1 hypothetical protein [Oscillatoriales cyanobacterium RU_3_3]
METSVKTEFANKTPEIQSEYLLDLLARIKQRPGMYLGKCSITRLRAFLDGYGMARGELGLPRSQQEQALNGFQEWIQERYQITSTHGWDSIILFFSADEKDALDKFFKLLEEFLSCDKIAEVKDN